VWWVLHQGSYSSPLDRWVQFSQQYQKYPWVPCTHQDPPVPKDQYFQCYLWLQSDRWVRSNPLDQSDPLDPLTR
jgi:hypothetical protein